MVVSVLPWIVDASIPAKLSGPYFIKISFIIDSDAVPDIGLKIAIGIISIGNLKFDNNGVKKENIEGRILLFKKIFIANTIARIEGNILKQVINPSFAPFKKESYISIFFTSP